MSRIYIIYNETTNRFKIGFSKDPLKRLKTLQTGNDNVLNLYYEREVKHHSKIEASLKRHFSPYRTTGEWFEYPLNFADLDDMIIRNKKMFKALEENPFV